MKQVAYGVFAWAFLQVHRKMESGYTAKCVKLQNCLTEPQGKLKI